MNALEHIETAALHAHRTLRQLDQSGYTAEWSRAVDLVADIEMLASRLRAHAQSDREPIAA